MRVVVTGGAGYIGSHTCKELAERGHEVVAYDNLCTGHREFVRWGDLVHGDVRDVQRLRACFRKFRPDGVIHFAASAYVGESVRDPGKYFSNNVAGTLGVLEAMRDEDVPNVVVSSTCAVYGQPDRIPIAEDAPTRPVNPYGASKLFMERMLADFQTAHGLGWMALRYFNAAGADPDGELWEWHEPETHLVPRALMAAAGKLESLEIFGGDYPTPDGTCVRDYVHVKDLAAAHLSALEHLAAGGDSMPLNLGTGSGRSVLEILDSVKAECGRPVPFSVRARREGDPAELAADGAKARRLLGWTPRHSSLDEIIRTASRMLTR